ncbi:putative endonuclease containing a URI domain [Sporolactobacillus inulinus]|jgi:putative endonuclease|uniref:Putative endonuclease containing a URI domain n=1 Tax=Sporolactobacillus inulinus TaxID=2078 RepID=A0A4Y1ZHP6_9BACL|nr:GIY-YIG nuclease family protein [Sporolactobacillus inulinus]GAY78520.1 putative endonuclease containing a URI domain [Sporolactobacillus inulinus]
MNHYSVYILECADGSLYTGYAADVAKRFAMHCSGRGARYTRSHKPLRIVYQEELENKSAALRREWSIKQLTRQEKLALIQRSGHDVGAAQFSKR